MKQEAGPTLGLSPLWWGDFVLQRTSGWASISVSHKQDVTLREEKGRL